jgi:hypothetical protein
LQGIGPIFGVLAVTALVLGPVLTFAVYRKGKKGLFFDLVVIALLQIAALGYGAWTIHSERPLYLVFALDRYNVLGGRDVDLATLREPALLAAPVQAPRLLVANMPMGEAFQRLQHEVLFEGKPDLERRPEFWGGYEQGRAAVLAGAQPVAALGAAREALDAQIRAAAREAGVPAADLLYAPVVGKRRDMVALVAPGTAELLEILDYDPFKK